ncbi:MAG: hypothetical protein ACREOU_04325 [Candidatus Eiseniibacteriota bacterium]
MNDTERAKNGNGWSLRGLEGELALFLLLPLFVGLLAASFLPWPEGRWVIVGAAGLLTALLVWWWLRRTHVRRLDRLAKALESGQAPDRGTGGPEDSGGFGELAGLAAIVTASVQRRRQIERELEELVATRATVERATEALDAWADSELPPSEPGGATPDPLLASLGRAAEQVSARSHEVRAVAGLVRDTVHDAAQRSEGVTAAAERQFVEATSLLTVLRELRRWEGELLTGFTALLEAPRVPPRSEATQVEAAAAIARARTLLKEIEGAASAPLEAASGTAARLTEAVGLHGTVEGDARVASIESAAASLTGVANATELTDSLDVLARDLAAAGERARMLERETETEIASAAREIAHLRALLGQVATALDEARTVAAAPVAVAATTASARRALDRMQEMIEEALARGEKLVQQAERTSSEALRAGDSMLGALDELEGLAARLDVRNGADLMKAVSEREHEGKSDSERVRRDAPDEPDEPDATEDPESDASARPLRVLGPADVLDDDGARFRG